jgi:hypothetical protein
VFCGKAAKLTNQHVFSDCVRTVLTDPSATGSLVYRQSKGPNGSPVAHSHQGDWRDAQVKVVCRDCNSGWMNQLELAVRLFVPDLITGRPVILTRENQRALAAWTVETVLMLQHTHLRAHQIAIPPADYAAMFAEKSPSQLMRVIAAFVEPPGRGTNVEATIEYLAEPRDMTAIATLMADNGEPDPQDLSAYTATLRIGFLVLHVIRIGSAQFVAGLSPGPAMRSYVTTIWPHADREHAWPPRSLAEIGGLIALARSMDTGVNVG